LGGLLPLPPPDGFPVVLGALTRLIVFGCIFVIDLIVKLPPIIECTSKIDFDNKYRINYY
jgi:hypothetical protein